jgi:hypothetical protein
MGHLILHVLSKPQMLLNIDSYFLEEKEDPCKEVSQGFIVHYLLLHCLADLKPFVFFHVLLVGGTVEWQFDVRN